MRAMAEALLDGFEAGAFREAAPARHRRSVTARAPAPGSR